MRGFCARQWCFGYIAPSTAARRHVEGVRDARHDISLLTSRFRAADVNARYERSVGVTSCCLYKSLHLAFLLVPAALVVGQSMQHGVKPAVLLSHAERAFVLVHFALWLGRAAVAVAHLAGRAPRAALEGATVLEVLARIIAQVGVAIPIALAWHNDGLLITSQLSAAVATLEVAALTRYEQALPVAAAVVGTQLYTIARAPAGAAEYGQPAVMLVALVTLPLFVHIEVVKRSAWLQGELLTSLRQEVSHFGARPRARRHVAAAPRRASCARSVRLRLAERAAAAPPLPRRLARRPEPPVPRVVGHRAHAGDCGRGGGWRPDRRGRAAQGDR